MRNSQLERRTLETTVQVSVDLDGTGKADIRCEPKFMQHMLTSFTVHSGLDLELKAEGDLQHHIIEDIALTLGKVIRECIDNIDGITRFGDAIIPMDCSLALVAIDICNRPTATIDLQTTESTIEGTQVQDLAHFLSSLATSLGATLHVKVLYGENDHHKVEAAFKALAIALREALRTRKDDTPRSSSKGGL